jgi:hypothetical protein
VGNYHISAGRCGSIVPVFDTQSQLLAEERCALCETSTTIRQPQGCNAAEKHTGRSLSGCLLVRKSVNIIRVIKLWVMKGEVNTTGMARNRNTYKHCCRKN